MVELLLLFTMLQLWPHVTSLTHSVYVKEGSSTQLECPQLTEAIATTWKGPLSEYPIADGRFISRYFELGKFNVIGNFTNGEYTLVIKNVTKGDIGDYLCDIVADGKPLQHTVKLILAQPPTQMVIHETDIVNRIHGIEGHIIKLTCTVKSGLPNETLKWTSQGTVLNVGGPRILTFYLIAKRTDHLQHYTCLANNSAIQKPLTKTIQLDIEFKPYVWTNGSTLISITEGHALSITCYQSSNPPSSGPKWWKLNGMGKMDLFANDSGLYVILVTRRDSGIYICEALNTIGTGSTNITINVLYPPTVRLVYDNYTETEKRREILCAANGNPAKYTFSKWEHKSEFGERIRYLNGYSNGSLVLPNTQNHSYQDSGIYKCTVSNGIPDTHGHTNQLQDAFLAIQGKPIILDRNQNIFYGIIDTQTYIYTEVYSVPKFTEIQLQDMNGVVVNRQGKATITDEIAVLRQKFHSTLIRLNGYRLKINFSTFSIKDIGNYSLNIDNSYGKDTKNFTIQVANPPNKPLNVSIKQFVNSVMVNWHTNFNGGFEQKFYIEYKIEGKGNWRIVESLNTTSSAEVSWQITGLRSSQTYFFRMFARNSLGESSRTDMQIVKTKGIGHDNGKMLIIYAVVSSAVGMSTIILSALICYCIKRKRSCEVVGNTSRAVTIDSPNIYDEIPSDHIPENVVLSNTAELHDEPMIITGAQVVDESQFVFESTAFGSQSVVSQVNDDYLHPCVKGQSEADSWGSGSSDLQINPDYLYPCVKRQSMSDSGSCSSRNESLQVNNDYLHPYVSLQPNWKETSKAEGIYMQQIK